MDYFFSIFFGTFVLEDVALAGALTLVSDNKLMWLPAFLACFLGISIGDLFLYFLGYATSMLSLEEKFTFIKKLRKKFVSQNGADVLTYSVIICRFIPGTRVPTYFVAGLLKYSFFKFLILTVITVGGWVGLAFIIGNTLNSFLMAHWFVTLILILVLLHLIKSFIPRLTDYWERKALMHRWRKWLAFEFWPASIFYLPIAPYYIYLSIKHLSFMMPFYANPTVENGGLVGESKWDFLKHLKTDSPHTLKTIKIKKQDDFEKARTFLIDESGFEYPFILKPDIGQRGFGVRIIRDDFDLAEYLLLANFDMIVQEFSQFQKEAGIFYVRYPNETQGKIFSITDKEFPFVIGDGKTRLGDLILKDERAKIIARTYFARHKEHLDTIPSISESIILSECGNHAQGAIFLNGTNLYTKELELEIDKVAKEMPHFYFGRFDLRYSDPSTLREGKNFEIVEVNGAGAEATHIWDSRTRLINAYKTLFKQWKILFEIGHEIKRKGIPTRISYKQFFKEIGRLFFSSGPLNTSS